MDEQWVSRFVLTSDAKRDTVIVRLPSTWWSRPYEYQWAENFAGGSLDVLDAASGISHPFKFWLAGHCHLTYACDIDPRIIDWCAMQQEIKEDLGDDALQDLQMADRSRLRFDLASILDLPYGARVMDRIFCLSVLEHLSQGEQLRALKEFGRVMKPQGLVVLTFDYPAVNMAFLQYAIRVTGLKFAGPVDFSIPPGGLISPDGHLRCFRAVLRPQQDAEETS